MDIVNILKDKDGKEIKIRSNPTYSDRVIIDLGKGKTFDLHKNFLIKAIENATNR